MSKQTNPRPTNHGDYIGVRLPPDLRASLDAYVARRNAAEPGLQLTRSDAVRVILAGSLAAEGGAR